MKTTIVIDTERETVRVSTLAHIGDPESRSVIDAILRDVLGENR